MPAVAKCGVQSLPSDFAEKVCLTPYNSVPLGVKGYISKRFPNLSPAVTSTSLEHSVSLIQSFSRIQSIIKIV